MIRRCLVSVVLLVSVLAMAQDAGDGATSDPGKAAAETTAPEEAGQDVGNLPVPAYQNDLPDQSPVTGGAWIKAIGSLMVVLGLVLGLSWVVKKYFPNKLMGATGGSHLRLIQNLPMGPNRYISLIEADGKRMLIGVTENQINLIKSLDDMSFEQALKDVESPKTVRQLMEEDVT